MLLRSSIKHAIQLIGGLGIGLMIVLGVAAWQLSKGSVSLAFLTGHLESALSANDQTFVVKIADTVLVWGGWRRHLEVRIVGVQVRKADGKPLLAVPELSLTLSGPALLKGKLAPRAIELYGSRLQLVRHRDGDFEVGLGAEALGDEGADQVTKHFFDDLMSRPDPEKPLSYLTRIVIQKADFTIVDDVSGASWHAPGSEIVLQKDDQGIHGEMSLDIEVEDQRIHLAAVGNYRPQARTIDFGLDFADASPAQLARLSPLLKDLSVFSLPLTGTIAGRFDPSGGVDSVVFDFKGGAGELRLPAPAAQNLPIRRVALRGRLEHASDSIVVDEFKAEFPENAALVVPAPVDHRWNLREAQAKGRYDRPKGRVAIDNLRLDLGGPSVQLSANVEGLGGSTAVVDLSGVLRDVPVNGIERVWPAAWGVDAHTWVVNNLSEGAVHEARAQVRARFDAKGGAKIDQLSGDMRMSGITVKYLGQMPPVSNVTATATFDTTHFDIRASHGQALGGLVVREGRVDLTGLDQRDQYADIDLKVDGPVKDALTLIDHKPLGFAKQLGISAADASGQASTRLKLFFILEKGLAMDQVRVNADSVMRGVGLRKVAFGLDLAEAELALSVDKRKMDIKGRGKLGSVPVSLLWQENFGPKVPFRTRYRLQGSLTSQQWATDLGFDVFPFSGGFLRGPIGTEVVLTKSETGEQSLSGTLDLKETQMVLPMLDWSKAAGLPAKAEIELDMGEGRPRAIRNLSVSAGSLFARGSIDLTADGHGVARIRLPQLNLGLSELALDVRPNDAGGWEVDLRGPRLDLEPMHDVLFKDKNKDPNATHPSASVRLAVDRMRLGPQRELTKAEGAFTYDGRVWRRVDFTGRLASGKALRTVIEPRGEKRRSLRVTSDDAGETLRVLDIFDNMVGGGLEITGEYDDVVASSPLTAEMRVTNYRVLKAPLLAHVLSIAALTGILESLSGEGLAFTVLEAPFVLNEGVLNLKDARATGSSLGLTASGTVYTHAEFLDLKGTVVPAYFFNSLLGNIPLLGVLVTGGEAGGGLFAANYEMHGPMKEPKVNVQTLSALAPGFLRNLFRSEEKHVPPPEAPSDN